MVDGNSKKILSSSEVLVVEDSKFFSLSYVTSLRQAGISACAVGTGEAALEHLSKYRAKVVLLDLHLPDMSGFEVMRQALNDYPGLIIIVVTADSSEEAAVKAIYSGAFDFLVKPFSLDRLVTTVRNGVEFSKIKYNKYLFDDFRDQIGCQLAFSIIITIIFTTLLMLAILIIYFFKNSLGINLFEDVHFKDFFDR